MTERDKSSDRAIGVNARPDPSLVTGTEVVAVIVSLVWLVFCGGYFLVLSTRDVTPSGDDPVNSLRFVMTLLAVFMPVAMVWVAAAAARSSRVVREESRRLQIAIDALRQSYLTDRQSRGGAASSSTVEKKLNEIAHMARMTEARLATFSTSRDTARPAATTTSPVPSAAQKQAEDQPALALGTNLDEVMPPLAKSDLIRALNFPDTDKDEEGFAALRRALKDRQAKQLVQASQDILTLLSQDGIYMDDMRPDRARPEVWRQFAKGERGRAVAALGGIRDRASLALAAGRMREDTIFRDAAHHFLRRFDQTLVALEPEATDQDIDDLSKTRTARAFMLLGRVTGAFD
jgi:hypothetical protein